MVTGRVCLPPEKLKFGLIKKRKSDDGLEIVINGGLIGTYSLSKGQALTRYPFSSRYPKASGMSIDGHGNDLLMEYSKYKIKFNALRENRDVCCKILGIFLDHTMIDLSLNYLSLINYINDIETTLSDYEDEKGDALGYGFCRLNFLKSCLEKQRTTLDELRVS